MWGPTFFFLLPWRVRVCVCVLGCLKCHDFCDHRDVITFISALFLCYCGWDYLFLSCLGHKIPAKVGKHFRRVLQLTFGRLLCPNLFILLCKLCIYRRCISEAARTARCFGYSWAELFVPSVSGNIVGDATVLVAQLSLSETSDIWKTWRKVTN